MEKFQQDLAENTAIVDLNVGGVLYKTVKGTLLGNNLRQLAQKQVEINQDLIQHHKSSTAETGNLDAISVETLLQDSPVPVPTILPTVFAELFEESDGLTFTNSARASAILGGGDGGKMMLDNPNTLPNFYLPNKVHDLPLGFQYIDVQNDLTSNMGGGSLAGKTSGKVLFIDRDGLLFRYVLDYMRTGKLYLPANFTEFSGLLEEAKFYRLPHLEMQIAKFSDEYGFPLNEVTMAGMNGNTSFTSLHIANGQNNVGDPNEPRDFNTSQSNMSAEHNVVANNSGTNNPAFYSANESATKFRERGYITVSYRGTFAFGRDGQADVKFRKLSRILICGRVSLCRQVFGDTLNESRDPDRGHYERYSSRFFLKHNFLEQAFDDLQRSGFRCVGVGASGTSSPYKDFSTKSSTSHDNEESRWNHYNEFLFCRP